MYVNMFSMGGLSLSQSLPTASSPNVGLSGFSAKSSLKPNLQQPNFSVDSYTMELDRYREKSMLIAASTFRIGKHEDGSVWIEGLTTNPQELLAQKRASGGEKEIAWNWVDVKLKTHTKDRLDTVAIEIDYFASEYAQYKTHIEQHYTGEEQQAKLAKLESLFATRVGEAAANFAKGVGDFLAASGVAGEHDALRNSFLDIYEQRKTGYLNFIVENDDYAHVKGTEDEWLLTAGDFMGEQLRYAYISQHPEMNLTSQYGYSVDDLNAAGILANELTYTSYAGTSDRSEVEVGVRLGLAAAKYAAISRHFDISSHVTSKLEQSMNHYLKSQLEKGSELIEQHRRDPYIRNKDPFAIDFNQNMAWEIIQRLVKDLSFANDITAVFKSDLDAFMALYKRQSDDILMGRMDRYSSHQSSLWMNENYAADWNRFVRQLAAFNYEEANRYLLKEPMQSVDISV